MIITCACGGLLGQPQGDTVYCTRCQRAFPFKEALQVLKMLKLSARETDNDGKPANEHVRRLALNKAAHKMAAMGLRAVEESEVRPAAPAPPPPVYSTAFYRESYTTTYGNGANFFIHITRVVY